VDLNEVIVEADDIFGEEEKKKIVEEKK